MLDFGALHFLRPLWLLGLIPAVLLYVVIRYQGSVERQWKGIIDPHLLPHLKTGTTKGMRFRPVHLISLVATLGSIAAAGPTWQREVSPFAEDAAPMVVALDLSPSMDAVDIQPSRLERAKQKVRDLLLVRPGARTALIVYSGTAHTVLPLSDDPSIFESFLAALSTNIMPDPGKNATAALALAESILDTDSVAGTILFLTDGIGEDHTAAFEEHDARSQDQVIVLAVGTEDGGPVRRPDGSFATDARGRRVMTTLDRAGLEALSSRAGVYVASITVDDRDVQQVGRRVQSHLRQVQQEDETARWRDMGYYALFPITLLGLLWFRRGWTVRWGAFLFVFVLQGCAGDATFADLWWTRDQQARRLYEAESYAEAAARFEDPYWKGVAAYRAGDLDLATAQFARLDTPEAAYNLGNTFALMELYEDALAAYEEALAARPDWEEAQQNRDLIAALLETPPEPEPQGQPGAPPSFDPDEIQVDDKADQGEMGEVEMSLLSDDQIAEMWMRRLQTSPADFLRWRFAAEAARQETGGR
jgi:Ca-activated chloride channel family protein